MSDEIQTTNAANVIESVVIGGDLSRLKSEERVTYYRAVCNSLSLNPLTRPFDYITLNGRLTLYARKEATDQLRKNNGVSITKLEKDLINDVYAVTAYALDRDGRTDSSLGAVFIGGLKGEPLANAMMKAETKAKRRVTLSICGLGMLDETEIETIPDAHPVVVTDEGEIKPGNGKPTMTLEQAKLVNNSKGVPLSTLPIDKLPFMAINLAKWLKEDHPAEERAPKELELEAIKVILANEGKVPQ